MHVSQKSVMFFALLILVYIYVAYRLLQSKRPDCTIPDTSPLCKDFYLEHPSHQLKFRPTEKIWHLDIYDNTNSLHLCVSAKAGATYFRSLYKIALHQPSQWLFHPNIWTENFGRKFPEKEYVDVAIIRNPKERLFSTFMDKIVYFHSHNNTDYIPMSFFYFQNISKTPNIDYFLSHLDDLILLKDPHIRPQFELCDMNTIHYEHVIRYEDPKTYKSLLSKFWNISEPQWNTKTAHTIQYQIPHIKSLEKWRIEFELAYKNHFDKISDLYYNDFFLYCSL